MIENLEELKDDLTGKRILVVGMARTGLAAAELLSSKNAEVILNDVKSADQIKDLDKIDFKVKLELGKKADSLVENSDLIVVSPGVPTDLEFFNIARSKNIKIISEIELAYIYDRAPVVAITGTNGKTTVTSLIGEIFKYSGNKTFVTGNIGIPMCMGVDKMDESSIVVVEVSSFQLETIETFKPKVSVILNFTPDHLNRHKTFENYIKVKCRIFENQDESDYAVLNYDDNRVRNVTNEVKAKVFYFTTGDGDSIKRGAYCKNGKVYIRDGEDKYVIDSKDIYIPGEHNLSNALAAVCAVYLMGIGVEKIAHVLKSFKGVEHRIEFAEEINGVRYYNDSKGTNVDATIVAIKAMKSPTVLIAGGYDKKLSFDELIKSFGDKIKHLILFGDTANQIKETAYKYGYTSVDIVENMNKAIAKASTLAKQGENVLLSPACASFDMFENYEQRGTLFKEEVRRLANK